MRRPILIALAAAAALAQNAPHIRDWKSPDPPSRAATTCAAMHSLTGYEYSVVSANTDAAGACIVRLQVIPEIRIEVALPVAWNGRLYMFGNGGFAGESLDAPNRVAQRNTAVKAGFAVAQTNTGHDAEAEPGASFAVDSQKLLDYSFRSLHVTAETAKRVAAAFYGRRPAKSYYVGCSTGGRQGLQFAQRFPDYFDGIVAGAPALNGFANRMRAIANGRAQGVAPLPTAKLKLLADAVYARCDSTDGLKDGLIDDPRRCDFKPARDLPVCSGTDRADCLTPAQLETVVTIYSDVVVDGKRLSPGFPVGAEIAGPNGRSGWDGWIVRDGELSQSASMALSALRYMVFPKPAPDFQLAQFDMGRDLPRLRSLAALMSATDPDLSRFRARGGKLLMYFGWADPALNPLLGIEYYEQAEKVLGPGTRDFFKLYMMPGVFHCSGGVGPACFDVLTQIVPWVEQDKAPEQIVARQEEGGRTVRSRPLCPYPMVARHSGSGSVDDAANFRCVSP
jgi:feruloyl esterase